MSSLPKRTAILYQNETRDVTLIDIPTSIAVAQGRPRATLLSTPPLETPFIIPNEPKKPKAREQQSHFAYSSQHPEYKAAIEAALTTLRKHVSPLPWCLPRTTQAPDSGDGSMIIDDPEKDLDARLREWSAARHGEEQPLDFNAMMASLGAATESGTEIAAWSSTVAHPWLASCRAVGPAAGGRSNAPVPPQHTQEPPEPWASAFYNPDDHAVELTITENKPQGAGRAQCRFIIPPRASLFLSDCTYADAFRTSFRQLTEEYVLPRHFNFVLLDPPWPSGSAKRKKNYEQVGGMPWMKKLLARMDIDNYIEHDGLVGIWITNKQSIRDFVLGPGGLFERWNVGLMEEWIWIKTTIKGEPMFSIDSEWRKPYEVLLLGRAAPNSWTTMAGAPEIKRRVIAAVPDLHSRKPCVKELIEPFMPVPNNYSALEVFSRYLVAGWTSWGNEVIKFNWERYWSDSGAEAPSN